MLLINWPSKVRVIFWLLVVLARPFFLGGSNALFDVLHMTLLRFIPFVAKLPALMAFSHAVFVGNPAQACKYLTICLVDGSLYTFLMDSTCFSSSSTYSDCVGVFCGSNGIRHMPLLPESCHPRKLLPWRRLFSNLRHQI